MTATLYYWHEHTLYIAEFETVRDAARFAVALEDRGEAWAEKICLSSVGLVVWERVGAFRESAPSPRGDREGRGPAALSAVRTPPRGALDGRPGLS